MSLQLLVIILGTVSFLVAGADYYRYKKINKSRIIHGIAMMIVLAVTYFMP